VTITNLMRLADCPQLAASAARHPAAYRQPARDAGTTPPAENVSRSGKAGKRPRWRCHHCGEGFAAWAPAQRHGHPPYGACRIELVL
jgi:hypothetical protein